jgi:hypothetical protein
VVEAPVTTITSKLRTVTPGPDTSTELIEKKFVDRPVMVTLVGSEPCFSELGLTERICAWTRRGMSVPASSIGCFGLWR